MRVQRAAGSLVVPDMPIDRLVPAVQYMMVKRTFVTPAERLALEEKGLEGYDLEKWISCLTLWHAGAIVIVAQE